MGRARRDDKPTRLCSTTRELCKLLNGEVNQELLAGLEFGERNVTDLTQAIGADKSVVSRGLARLQRYRLVLARGEGRKRFYRLSSNSRVVTRDSTIRITARSSDGGLVKLVSPTKALRPAREQRIRA